MHVFSSNLSAICLAEVIDKLTKFPGLLSSEETGKFRGVNMEITIKISLSKAVIAVIY
jgi:hypothetical protein